MSRYCYNVGKSTKVATLLPFCYISEEYTSRAYAAIKPINSLEANNLIFILMSTLENYMHAGYISFLAATALTLWLACHADRNKCSKSFLLSM